MPVRAFDSWMKHLSRSGALLLAVLVVGAVLVACGGGDDKDSKSEATATVTATASGSSSSSSGSGAASATAASTSTTGTTAGGSSDLGTEKGRQVANAAMLVVADLPGQGWSQTSADDFGGSILDAPDSDVAQTPACSNYVKKITDAAKKAEAARVGRAARSFQQEGALFGMSVDVEVSVFKDSKVPASLISDAKGAIGSADFENCFREILKSSGDGIPSDTKFELKSAKPLASAPNNGISQAYDLSISSSGISFSMHAELYGWANKNASALVTIFGTPDDLKPEAVKAAIAKTDEKLSKAQ